MAGHSHWAQIKYKKASVDKKRSLMISKLVNLILTAGRDNPNPETNFKLKSAIERAKDFGVPQEVIDRNLKKLKDKSNNDLEEIILEAYGPEGLAILIKCLTNNKNRTINDIKHILSKHNAKLAEPGSVLWLFEEKGVISINKTDFNEMLLEELSDVIEDFKENDESVQFFVKINDIYKIKSLLEEKKIKILSTEIQFIPKNYVKIENEEKVKNLIDELLDYNDVYEVFTNQ
jgi:YebC/PmpR family DNA-binding regulatory protein